MMKKLFATLPSFSLGQRARYRQFGHRDTTLFINRARAFIQGT